MVKIIFQSPYFGESFNSAYKTDKRYKKKWLLMEISILLMVINENPIWKQD